MNDQTEVLSRLIGQRKVRLIGRDRQPHLFILWSHVSPSLFFLSVFQNHSFFNLHFLALALASFLGLWNSFTWCLLLRSVLLSPHPFPVTFWACASTFLMFSTGQIPLVDFTQELARLLPGIGMKDSRVPQTPTHKPLGAYQGLRGPTLSDAVVPEP